MRKRLGSTVSIDSMGDYNHSAETYLDLVDREVEVHDDNDDGEDAAVNVDDVELQAIHSGGESSPAGATKSADDDSVVHLQAVVKWSTWGSKLDQWTVHYE